MTTKTRVLVTGGGTFLGENIATALLAEGAEVTLLVRPGATDKLGALAARVRWWEADVWNPASLKGHARHHDAVVHTVGGLVADTKHGLSFNTLNYISARNVANMCVSGGVKHMVLLSGASAPWINGQYIRAKRDAEAYLSQVGLQASIIRAPLVYVRGRRRSPFYQLVSLVGIVPPLSWTSLSRVAPLPVDVLARAVARITLGDPPPPTQRKLYYARDLKRLNSRRELRRPQPRTADEVLMMQPPDEISPYHFMNDETPFGWSPPPGTPQPPYNEYDDDETWHRR